MTIEWNRLICRHWKWTLSYHPLGLQIKLLAPSKCLHRLLIKTALQKIMGWQQTWEMEQNLIVYQCNNSNNLMIFARPDPFMTRVNVRWPMSMLTWSQLSTEVTILISSMTKITMTKQIKGGIPNTQTLVSTRRTTKLAASHTWISFPWSLEKLLPLRVIFNKNSKQRFAGIGRCQSVHSALNAHLLTVNTSYSRSPTFIQITGPKSATTFMRSSIAHMEIGANFTMQTSPNI